MSVCVIYSVSYMQDEELDASPFEADDGLMIGDDDDDVSDDEDDDHEVVFLNLRLLISHLLQEQV